jgi:hypothetical protein
VCPGPPSRNQRKAIIGGAICRFSNSNSNFSIDFDLMMHVSISYLDSAPRAGFGLLSGSWGTPAGRGVELCADAIDRAKTTHGDRAQHTSIGEPRYVRVIADELPQGRMSALNHQRIDAMSRSGAGFDRRGRTP